MMFQNSVVRSESKSGKDAEGGINLDDINTFEESKTPLIGCSSPTSFRTGESSLSESESEDEELGQSKKDCKQPRTKETALKWPNLIACLVVILIEVNALYKCYLEGQKGYIGMALTIFLYPFFVLVELFFIRCLIVCIWYVGGPTKYVRRNSQFYSITKPKVPTVLPKVTIQMPVYKEGLNGVIRPTVKSLQQAAHFYEKHGGQCNIFINDDGFQVMDQKSKKARIKMYTNENIGFVARPPKGRKGLFKKASNMNYCLNISDCVKREVENRSISPTEALKVVKHSERYDNEFVGGGDILVGDLILIVDSDTRVPESCILDTVGEFVDDSTVGFTQHQTTAMKMSTNYWENMISWFTDFIYHIAITLSTSGGEPCPLVGHNAFLRWSALQEVALKTENNFTFYWSEDNVSEDFDLALRLARIGYVGRYVTYTGNDFMEGVSLTFHDEMVRLRKYAYGACEMMFNPFREWPRKGILHHNFIKFLSCRTIPWFAKVSILAYLGSYVAMSCAVYLLVIYISLEAFLKDTAVFILAHPWNIFVTITGVFSVLVPLSTVILLYRLDDTDTFNIFKEAKIQMKYTPLVAFFFGGILYHLTTVCYTYFTGAKVVWGATVKEIPDTNFFLEMKLLIQRYWRMYLVMAAIILYWVALIHFQLIEGCVENVVPMGVVVGYHMLSPILLNPYLMRAEY